MIFKFENVSCLLLRSLKKIITISFLRIRFLLPLAQEKLMTLVNSSHSKNTLNFKVFVTGLPASTLGPHLHLNNHPQQNAAQKSFPLSFS